MLVMHSVGSGASSANAVKGREAKAQPGTPAPHPAMVNFTTTSLEPAPVSSGWNSESVPITFTPTMLQ